MKWAELSVLFVLREKGIKLGLKEKIRNMASSPPQEPLAPPSERAAQVMSLLLNNHATIRSRVPVHAGMWQRWAQVLAEEIVDVLCDEGSRKNNTLIRRFDQIRDDGIFIMGLDAEEATVPLGAITALNGHHEVYRKVGDQAFSTVSKMLYDLPPDCPTIPIFIGSSQGQ